MKDLSADLILTLRSYLTLHYLILKCALKHQDLQMFGLKLNKYK